MDNVKSENSICYYLLSRYSALETTRELLPMIFRCLLEITTQDDFHADKGCAQSLLNNLTFEFVVSLVICQVVLDTTSSLSRLLQGTVFC